MMVPLMDISSFYRMTFYKISNKFENKHFSYEQKTWGFWTQGHAKALILRYFSILCHIAFHHCEKEGKGHTFPNAIPEKS